MSTGRSAQPDRFVHEKLPAKNLWPQISQFPGEDNSKPFNCTSILLDKNLEEHRAGRIAIYSQDNGMERAWTYQQLNARVCRIANVLRHEYDIVAGNRVMIYAPNSPEVAAIWLAIQKIGAVAVTTLALLRAEELRILIDKSVPTLAICHEEGAGELAAAIYGSKTSCHLLSFTGEDGKLYELMACASDSAPTCATLGSDISIIAFTSGTTGDPKATIHFHRDIKAICETVCCHIVTPTPDDIFISTSPLAFTFGLGGLLVFPLYAGAATLLNGSYTPESYIETMVHFNASVCFTVPTFYQRLAKTNNSEALANLRLAVSSGEALPSAVRHRLQSEIGVNLVEVIGSTEMTHAFAGANCASCPPGTLGPAIAGYTLAILDDKGDELPIGETGHLAVKGPTGCRYMDDGRQENYVKNGWNITGDLCHMDALGNIAFHTRSDDMIISAGYNISGSEVENVLLEHPLVEECAVIGAPNEARGQIVEAHIVLTGEGDAGAGLEIELQDFVKSKISPHKYPRAIVFASSLPKTPTGKIKRHALRNIGR